MNEKTSFHRISAARFLSLFLLLACFALAPGTAGALNTGGDFGEQVDVKGGEKPYIGGRDKTPQPSSLSISK